MYVVSDICDVKQSDGLHVVNLCYDGCIPLQWSKEKSTKLLQFQVAIGRKLRKLIDSQDRVGAELVSCSGSIIWSRIQL